MDDFINKIELARQCVGFALEAGASQVRVSLSKSVTDTVSMLNGVLDKVSHSADQSIFLHIFVNGRYGTFSTNRLDREELSSFVRKAVAATGLLAPDPLHRLPAIELCASNAKNGKEAGLYDDSYFDITSDQRLSFADRLSRPGIESESNYSIVSVEAEYSDNIDDNFIVDSNGFEGRHTETEFTVSSEVTIQDKNGNKLSGFWWDSSPFIEKLDFDASDIALKKAVMSIGPKKVRSGVRKMVVDRSVSSRLVSPIINALYASNIQQKNSFLLDCVGKKVFGENFSLMDFARMTGHPGARLFDTEGVATMDRPVIENGVVKMYFTDTYNSGKLGLAQTIEGPSVPTVIPSRDGTSLQDLIDEAGTGILVTGFNGGNCNTATGDFSYGVEGFVIKGSHTYQNPVREMVITGNMKDLWHNLVLAADDARQCSRWQIPSLLFKDVHFSM